MPHDDLTYVQGPVMTAEHVEALRIVEGWWPFPGKLELGRIREVRQHLEAQVGRPPTIDGGPQRTEDGEMRTENGGRRAEDVSEGRAFDDWRLEYAPPTEDDCYDCDQ